MQTENRTIQIERALRKELKRAMNRSCILCDARSTNAHLWKPTPEHIVRHGGNPANIRIYAYGVCDRHDPNQMHLFESKEVIMKQIDATIIKNLIG